ncbi:hypothetical protein SteCoe_22430 [Stentor coeruleus]|uniref:Uncharacterized protein n=1 Tax=Stentor coeruleus TaxID=5963 RepID=A0A1R2BMF4_9CILI|nr:hypothetical protein SteCoe_22430 [Stentor coeruleus]
MYESSSQNIINHLKSFVGNVINFATLHDEEQEVELEIEIEIEQEVQIQRPKYVDPHTPKISKHVVNLLTKKVFNNNSSKFLSIPTLIKETTLSKFNENNTWSSNIYLTSDYVKTVSKYIRGDDYLRPSRWVAKVNYNDQFIIVILSGYEANKLKNNLADGVNLFMLMPRLRIDQINYFCIDGGKIPEFYMQQLMIFAGSQYFVSNDEVDEYLKFVGYCPGPRNQHEQECFDNGMISKHGFVLPMHRKIVLREQVNAEKCKFSKDPADLVTGLAEIRARGQVSMFAHHLSIFRRGRRPFNYP